MRVREGERGLRDGRLSHLPRRDRSRSLPRDERSTVAISDPMTRVCMHHQRQKRVRTSFLATERQADTPSADKRDQTKMEASHACISRRNWPVTHRLVSFSSPIGVCRALTA